MNLCGPESSCVIRRDFCHNFVSERDFVRDAQRVCQAERSLSDESLGRDEMSFVRLTTNNVFSQLFNSTDISLRINLLKQGMT